MRRQRRDRRRRPPRDRRTAGASRHARERGDLRTDHHDERHDPAGPDRRVTARDLGPDGVGGHQRVGGVGQTVEMQTTGSQGHHPDRDDGGEDGSPDRRRPGRPARRARRSGRRPTGTRPRRSRRRAAGASGGGSAATSRRAWCPRALRRPPLGAIRVAPRGVARAPGPPRRPSGSCASSRVADGGPSATIRPLVHDHDPREEVGGQGEVVQDRDDRRADAR